MKVTVKELKALPWYVAPANVETWGDDVDFSKVDTALNKIFGKTSKQLKATDTTNSDIDKVLKEFYKPVSKIPVYELKPEYLKNVVKAGPDISFAVLDVEGIKLAWTMGFDDENIFVFVDPDQLKSVRESRVGKILESLHKIKEAKLTPAAEEVFRKLKAGEYKGQDQIPHEDFMLIFNAIYEDSGCFLDKAEKVIEEYGDKYYNQECYCGYSASKDVFLMAFEGSKTEEYENYDGEEEEADVPLSVVVSGKFDPKTSRWSNVKEDEEYDAMFYGGAHKHLTRKYPDLVGIRLD